MKILKTLIIFCLLWFIIHELIVVIRGITAKPINSEYAVILGNQVFPDGTLSPRLKARVDKGLELYKNNIVQKIFVSGGLGVEGHYEGTAMANYLVQNDVPKEDIIIDDLGNTSWLTAKNFHTMLPDAQSVVVVSQYYHIVRCELAFSKVGIQQISGASPDFFEYRDLYSLFREFFGYYKYLIVY